MAYEPEHKQREQLAVKIIQWENAGDSRDVYGWLIPWNGTMGRMSSDVV